MNMNNSDESWWCFRRKGGDWWLYKQEEVCPPVLWSSDLEPVGNCRSSNLLTSRRRYEGGIAGPIWLIRFVAAVDLGCLHSDGCWRWAASGRTNQSGEGRREGQGEDDGSVRYLDRQWHVDVALMPNHPPDACDGQSGNNRDPQRFPGHDDSRRRRQCGRRLRET